MEAPQGRRDDFVDPYFKRAKADEVVAVLRAREPGSAPCIPKVPVI
jgi:hypothetical protein